LGTVLPALGAELALLLQHVRSGSMVAWLLSWKDVGVLRPSLSPSPFLLLHHHHHALSLHPFAQFACVSISWKRDEKHDRFTFDELFYTMLRERKSQQ